jgi:hypothetical protein
MAYIGQPPLQEFTSAPTKDSFTGDGSTTTFDLAQEVVSGGEYALEVFIDNVRQEPGTGKAFTVGNDASGDEKRITFTAAPANGAVIYVLNDKTNLTAIAPTATDLNGTEFILDADADTTLTADTDDQIDIKISGADDFQFTANTFTALSGSTIKTNTIAETTAASGVTIDGVLLKDGVLGDNTIDSNAYVDGSIDLAHMSSESVDEDNLHISNAGSNGQYLQKQSGNSGGLTWAAVSQPITALNNATANELTTVGSTTTELDAESNLTFDGSTLAVTGAATVSTTLGVTGILTGSNTVIGTTFEPTGDTSASDNAAVGYTSGEGLILTGQGSTNDVTIKNDADADVITIATGTTNVDVVGDFTAGTVNADGDTAAGDNATMGYTAGEGLILTGQGSTNDITIKNDADAAVISIPTGTTNATVAGTLTATAFAGSGAALTGLPGGSFTAAADGALTAGCSTIIQADGTVQKIAETVVSQAIPAGTPGHITSNTNLDIIGAALDPGNSGKGVIIYRVADGSTDHIKAIVFTTASDNTTITYGSVQNMYSISNGHRGDDQCVSYTAGGDKFVTGGVKSGDTQNGSTNGYVRVHTVSGTTVTTGSESTVNGSYTNGLRLMCDQTVDDRVFAMYVNSPYAARAKAATISGTTPSWGSEVTFSDGNANPHQIDYRGGRCLVSYQDHGSSFNAEARALTISGNSITAGNPVTMDDAFQGRSSSVTINPNNINEGLFIFQDRDDSEHGKAKFLTISTNTISAGSEVDFASEAIDGQEAAWDKNYEDKFIVQYRIEGDTHKTKFKVGTNSSGTISFGSEIEVTGSGPPSSSFPGFNNASDGSNYFYHIYNDSSSYDTAVWSRMGGASSTNISATNFIGFSKAAYSDGATATILVGGAVTDEQSSLTPASKYYVQNDGSLSTSADSPSVVGGQAVASTKLLITDTTLT